MKRYQGAIFDLDGTLLDTIADLSDSVNEVLLHFGFPPHSYDSYKLKIGRGFKNLLEVSLPEGSAENELLEEALSIFLKIYDKKYMDKTKPYEGICQMLHALQNKNIKLAVNSNKRTDYTNHLIQKNFADILFVDIIGERAGIPKKPSPVSALEIADKMKLFPEEILYIGDSGTDILTGKNAQMDTMGVLWGFRGEKELKDNGATYLAKTAEEIVRLF